MNKDSLRSLHATAIEAAREFGATEEELARCQLPVVDHACTSTPVVDQKAANLSDNAEIDRDTDGELLIDWSPGKGRMVTLSLRADGRLSYAFTWDGEQAHGTAQMPASTYASLPVCFVCQGTGKDLSVDHIGVEGWQRLAESQQALAETEQRIKELRERYGKG